MLSNALTSWVPWFVAARASEAKLTLMHANDGGDGGGTSGTIGGTVGGTVGGTIGGTIGGVGAVNGGAGGGVDAGCLAASGVASDVGTVSAPTFDTESTPRLRTPQVRRQLLCSDFRFLEVWARLGGNGRQESWWLAGRVISWRTFWNGTERSAESRVGVVQHARKSTCR
eukprot:6189211-Pleurochrysis_carterae.AAC.1